MPHYVRWRLKKILLAIISFSLLWHVCSIIYFYFNTECMGLQYQHILCEKYKQGEIKSGSDFCEKLCGNNIKLSSCVDSPGDNQIFNTWNHEVKILKDQFDPVLKSPNEQFNLFFYPLENTSFGNFKRDVYRLLEVKLGPGLYDQLVEKAVSMVDTNMDGQINLPQAKTLWSLLQNNEFLILTLFQGEINIPELVGHCGNLYGLQHPFVTYLYNNDNKGLLRSIFPRSNTWMFPSWEKRAKLAYSLIELVYTLTEHPVAGTFYICSWDEHNIGYSAKYEAHVTDFSQVISKYSFGAIMRQRSCDRNADCQYGKYCRGVCNKSQEVCTNELEHPSITQICKVLEYYILEDAPIDLRESLEELFAICRQLKDNASTEVQHAVLVMNFKSLLWSKIQHLSS